MMVSRSARLTGRILLAVPVDGRADVVVLDVEPFQPVLLAQPGQRAPGFPGQGQEGSRVRPAKASGFRRAGQTFSCELADRLQHQETRLPRRAHRAQQALIHQLLQAVQHRHTGTGLRADRLDDPERHAAPKHRTGRQQPPGLIPKQAVAPFDGGTQSLLAIWQVTAPACQQAQRMLQPLKDRLRRQQPDPRRGQLDGQRQAVKPAHDLGHHGGVPLINGKARHRGRGPLGEQPHRFARSDGLRTGERIVLRDFQWRDRALLLTRHAQRRAAAHHDPQSARGCQQLGHHRCGRQQMLKVVQDQQELAIPQVTGQVLY